MIYQFTVRGDRLYIDPKKNAYTGNVNTYTCRFDFDAEWDGLERFMVVQTETQNYGPILIADDRCSFPNEALEKPGAVNVGVYGTGGTGTDFRRISTN